MVIYEHEAQYYETDQMGIIHHSNYIRWFESARIHYLKEIGIDYAECEKAGFISPVMGIECEYKSMVHFGDTVEVHTAYETYNGVKLFVAYEVYNKATGELCCTGRSKHCFLNKDGKPISLKRDYPELHEKMAASAGPLHPEEELKE